MLVPGVGLDSDTITAPEIDAAVARLSDDSRWNRRDELKRLSGHLEAGARVRALAGAYAVDAAIDGLVVVTDDRLLLVDAATSEEGKDVVVTFRWDEVASVEFRDGRVKLSKVRGPGDEGWVAGIRRFLTDTPLTLDLAVSDRGELSDLYDVLVANDGPLRDRALSVDFEPQSERRVARPALKPEPFERIRRRVLWDDVRSGSLPLHAAGWVVALGSLALATLGLPTEQQPPWCTWTGDRWLASLIIVGPPVAAVLIVLGERRVRHEEVFGWLVVLGLGLVVIVSLMIYGSALVLLSGRCL